MSPYFQDDAVTLWHGDAAGTLAQLPDASVDCIVTSPPYFGLRDYGVDGQIGVEPTPAAFAAALVAVFREARRVLADGGTLWLNLGDSYAAKARGSDAGWDKSRLTNPGSVQKRQAAALRKTGERHRGKAAGVAEKNLFGIPWRVALALQDDGWILRNEIIWAKPNAMPESVQDRLSNRHEHVFLFTKRQRYWFDLDVLREHAGGRNPGDVWTIPTQPFAAAHFATMPPELARRCVLAGCRPGGVVLDPFSGAGTTGLVATENDRRYVGIDLNEQYLELSLRTRLKQGVLDLGVGA